MLQSQEGRTAADAVGEVVEIHPVMWPHGDATFL